MRKKAVGTKKELITATVITSRPDPLTGNSPAETTRKRMVLEHVFMMAKDPVLRQRDPANSIVMNLAVNVVKAMKRRRTSFVAMISRNTVVEISPGIAIPAVL